jgi:organic hydroperoxide reductase OsmC/OhrA
MAWSDRALPWSGGGSRYTGLLLTMADPPPRPTNEFPPASVNVDQVERYRFVVSYPEASLPTLTVDEPVPLGTGAGADPARALAGAVGHCLSSTLFNTLERSHVRATPIRTTVTVTFGRNGAGRKRVVGLDARIDCAPIDKADQDRFDRCVAIFEEYCTVTGSVREGIRVGTHVGPLGDGGSGGRAEGA